VLPWCGGPGDGFTLTWMNTLSYRKRLNLARGVMGLALVVLAVAHFLPLEGTYTWATEGGGRLGFYGDTLTTWWARAWHVVQQAIRGSLPVTDLLESAGLFTVGGLLLAMPFLAGFLSRARPLRWTAGFLLVGIAGNVTGWVFSSSSMLKLPGPPVLMAGLWTMVLGALLIPQAPQSLPGNGKDATTEDEDEAEEEIGLGWRKPLWLALGCAVMATLPWWLNGLKVHHEKQMAEQARHDACRGFLLATQNQLRDFQASHERLPTLKELWPTPPVDPWGAAYHYSVSIVNDRPRAVISSNGADGKAGTEDDQERYFLGRVGP